MDNVSQLVASKRAAIDGMIKKNFARLASACPAHLSPRRMAGALLTLLSKTPDLYQCTDLSIYAGLIQAAELGLELSPQLGQAWLIPYRNNKAGTIEAQFQVGAKGWLALAYRSKKVKMASAHVIHQKDEFQICYGLEPDVKHVPRPAFHEGKKTVAGAYAALALVSGGRDVEWMTTAQIESHKEKYSKGWEKPGSAWQTAWEEMAVKTVLKKLLKRAPLSVEIAKAGEYDDAGEAGETMDQLTWADDAGEAGDQGPAQARTPAMTEPKYTPAEAPPTEDF